jgi:DNA-directed RNA polymerase subunit alpha
VGAGPGEPFALTELVTPNIEVEEESEGYARLVAEPVEAGFGVTLGNALRRVLLSSLPGAAVTSVRIEEVQHEFSTIPHMKEDTTEFLLNVKEIRLRALSDRPAKLYLEGHGEGRILAGDIQVTADYEIVNPELHLATLDSAEAHLTVEFNVERGRGWVPAGRQTDGTPIGVIPVDAIFTPVRRVNFAVERTRLGQVTNYDRLVLQVWTDGTVTCWGSSLSLASSASLRPPSWHEAWARVPPWNRIATTRQSRSSTFRYAPTTASSAAGS